VSTVHDTSHTKQERCKQRNAARLKGTGLLSLWQKDSGDQTLNNDSNNLTSSKQLTGGMCAALLSIPVFTVRIQNKSSAKIGRLVTSHQW